MCHPSIYDFFIENSLPEEFKGKRVLEVGSRYVNGSVRPLIEKFFHPKEYIGIDIQPGKYVDIILPGEKIIDYFGEESFDAVICTEVLEHVRDPKVLIHNIKTVLKREGILYITTRSKGFPYHSYPYDFWRYEIEDFQEIFKDFEILVLEKDPEAPGLLFKAKKPKNYEPINIENINLYSILFRKRIDYIPDVKDISIIRRFMINVYNSKFKECFASLIPYKIKKILKKYYV